MRFLVTGGRKFDDIHLVRFALMQLPETATLVHGACDGADMLCAEFWSNIHRRVSEEHPANWPVCEGVNCTPGHRRMNKRGKEYCPTAGHLRNQKMVDSGIDLCVVFPGETGTADCLRRVRKAGIEVLDMQMQRENERK